MLTCDDADDDAEDDDADADDEHKVVIKAQMALWARLAKKWGFSASHRIFCHKIPKNIVAKLLQEQLIIAHLTI